MVTRYSLPFSLCVVYILCYSADAFDHELCVQVVMHVCVFVYLLHVYICFKILNNYANFWLSEFNFISSNWDLGRVMIYQYNPSR